MKNSLFRQDVEILIDAETVCKFKKKYHCCEIDFGKKPYIRGEGDIQKQFRFVLENISYRSQNPKTKLYWQYPASDR